MTAPPPSEPNIKQWLTDNGKRVRFAIGFVGWWVAFSLVLVLLIGGGQGSLAIYDWIFVFPVQVIVLIILAFKQRQVALGMLSAIALNLVLSLLRGAVVSAVCFIPLWSPYY